MRGKHSLLALPVITFFIFFFMLTAPIGAKEGALSVERPSEGFTFTGAYRVLTPHGNVLKSGAFSFMGAPEVGSYEFRVVASQPTACVVTVKVLVEGNAVAQLTGADVSGSLKPEDFVRFLPEGAVKEVNFTYVVTWKTGSQEWAGESGHSLPLVRFYDRVYYYSGVGEGEFSKVSSLTSVTVLGLSASPAIVVALSVFFLGLPYVGRRG